MRRVIGANLPFCEASENIGLFVDLLSRAIGDVIAIYLFDYNHTAQPLTYLSYCSTNETIQKTITNRVSCKEAKLTKRYIVEVKRQTQNADGRTRQ